MLYSWIICQMLLVTGSIDYANGETTTEISTSPADHHGNHNDDYPVDYDDYQNPDYPVPDYYGEERDSRSLDNEIPDPGTDENYLKQLESTIPGIPGVDYPMYHTVPDTPFRCDAQRGPGFYGDVDAQCQVFHICQEDGRHDSFICPVGTVFNQMNLICDWWFNFKCANTPTFFSMNAAFEPGSHRMEDVMKKMRRFRETGRRNNMASLTNRDQEMEKIQKRMQNRNGIMNLFSPKMRSGNIWKRLRAEKVIEDVMVKAATVNDRNEDFRSLGTTDVIGYTTSDHQTTLLTTTDASSGISSQNVPSEGTSSSQLTSISNNDEDRNGSFEPSTNLPHSVKLHDTLKTNDTIEHFPEEFQNELETTYTIPTENDHTHTTEEIVTFSKVPIDTNEDLTYFFTPPDLSADNNTDIYATFSQDLNRNDIDVMFNERKMQSKKLNNFVDTAASTPDSFNSSQLPLKINSTTDRNYSLTLGNDTHISVSVTIRAGISRLKWKRLPEGKNMKNLKLKNASVASLDDSDNISPMDLMFRKRMRNNKPNTRIMWIPSKNDTLRRKSVWRIFVNSKPRLGVSRNASKLLYDVINMNKNAFEPLQADSTEKSIEINSKMTQMDKQQDMEDISNTTLQTENTELAYTLMMPSETGMPSEISNTIQDNPIALPLIDSRIENSENVLGRDIDINSEDHRMDNVSETFEDASSSKVSDISGAILNRNFENDQNNREDVTTEGKQNENCRTICVKLLQSIEKHDDETSKLNSYPVSVFRQTADDNDYITYSEGNVKSQFGRRSFLGASPTEQWGVKYEPDTKCNENAENGKGLIKGWSIIVDAGSVTKEKTVKRRGCDSIFNDSKMIVMKSSKPHRNNAPTRGHSKANYPLENRQNNIRFGSSDQQYWLTLVKNWLESAPDSNMKTGSDSRLTKQHKQQQTMPASRIPRGDTLYQGRSQNDPKHSDQRKPFPSQRNKNDHSATNKQVSTRHPKKDWSMNENRRNNMQNSPSTNRYAPKNTFNKDLISRGNFGSNSGEKWAWSQQTDNDVMSSQSNRREWQVYAGSKEEIDDDKRDNLRRSQEFTSSRIATQSWPRYSIDANVLLASKNVAEDWSSRNNDEEQYFLEKLGSKNARGKRDWDSQQQSRDRANRTLSNGFSSDELAWLSDRMDFGPNRYPSDNTDQPVQSNNNDQWSLDSDTKAGFSRDLKKTSWPSENINYKGSKTTGGRKDTDDTNIKSDLSTKNTGTDWPSKSKTNNERPRTKGSDVDPKTRNKSDRDGRRNPRTWNMKNEQSWPSQKTWNPDNSKTSSRPKPLDENKGWSSNDKDKPWSSRDEQKKDEWMPDRKVDKAWSSNDQQGMADWGSDIKVDKAWSSDDQQGKTDWISDSKKDQAWSAGDQQGKDGWDSDKGDKAWSSRDQQGKADAWSDSKQDGAGSSGVKQEKIWPSVNGQDDSWSPGDQQLKADWSSDSKRPKVWSSRDQQGKADWSTSNRGDEGSSFPSSTDQRKEFPKRNKDSDSPPLRNNKGRIPSNSKGSGRDTIQDMQKDISESSFKGNTGIKEDWSTKHAMNKPVWTTDESNSPSIVNKNDDDWFLDNRKDESIWYEAPINGNHKDRNRTPNTRVPNDWNSDRNSPDISDRRSWNSDSSSSDSFDRSSGRFNVNKPKRPTSSKGSNTSLKENTRSMTQSTDIWDSDSKPPEESVPPYNSNSAWSENPTSGPPFSKAGNNDDSLRNWKSDDENKGSIRNPSSQSSSWSDNKNIPNPSGYKGQNRQSDWSDENKSTSTYLSNRRDEMNLDWWDADEEFGTNSNGPKQGAQSWSSAADDDVRSSNIQPDWSSKPKENKMSSKNRGDWSLNPRESRMLDANDDDRLINKKAGWSSEPTIKRMSKTNTDWSSNKNPNWSTESSRAGTSKRNRGISSGWDKGSDQSMNRQSIDGPWKTKGATKTATTSKDWNDPPETKTGKPWKDDKEPPTKINNMKGEEGMKEEKIVWSHQISSNGDLGNGWVPITLRPNLKGPENQTRVQNNDKGSPKSGNDWSGVKQQMDRWDSEGLMQNTPSPQFKMDSFAETVSTSSEIPDASDNHPFYIPFLNKRFKRASRLVSLTKNYIRPRAAKRIYNVVDGNRDLKNIGTDENHRFYLASADILVGDDIAKRINKTSANDTRESMNRLLKSNVQFNETIKNSIPSLTRLKYLRNHLEKRNSTLEEINNSKQLEIENSILNSMGVRNNLENKHVTLRNVETFKDYQKLKETPFDKVDLKLPQKDQTWDSLMEESETKELWSSPFDSSNVPESGWIPLFRVNKTAINSLHTRMSNEQKNETKFNETAHRTTHPKDLEENETVVVINSKIANSNYSSLPNDTEVSEIDQNRFLTHNFTIDIDAAESELSSEQNMKEGNRTLRIIPFSDIMKQLMRNDSSNSEIEAITPQEEVFSNKDEWNIPIVATPKMYGLKLVDDNEMQSKSIGSSWTFAKGKPKGLESWVLVESDDSRNKTENKTATENKQKYENSTQKINTLFRIIVGNRTREQDVLEDNHKEEDILSRSSNNHPEKNEFSFDLKNWHRDSGWTPLVRAIGSVTTRKVDHGRIQPAK